ncbi:unnamed protein product [Kuraishia capsulata CBS 1993]|uniref:U2 small nuclear ribonucleoprotein A' n=1 Tax=Kuraishia capsulata CBS 1993 TaxID=1382522 RepID=W6MVS1_9ASCO|nr:uncharacterized protein KUCA_T00002427001 [Kuraishia capsulata CBS 1993]CDK26455.1 unnamed protein product [Kuraishia capsulata CBS 1993]
MKLTSQVLAGAPSFLNPAGDRVLSLRGLRAPMIENLGETQDCYETIDFTDNDIRVLGNFPVLIRLKTILIAKNRVNTIHASFPKSLPNIKSISLIANNITGLADLDALKECSKLENLYLGQNPVTHTQNYRSWLIWRIPSLKVLDFEKVKDREREVAKALFGTHDEPTKLANELTKIKATTAGPESKENKQIDLMITKLTPEARAKLEEDLKKATTLAEIDRIETALKTGRL